ARARYRCGPHLRFDLCPRFRPCRARRRAGHRDRRSRSEFCVHLSGLCTDHRIRRRTWLHRRLICRRRADRGQRCRRKILRARARRFSHLSGHGRGADVAARRPVRETVMASATTITPQAYMLALSRWHPLEIIFWLATLLPFVLFPNYLSLASQIAITA